MIMKKISIGRILLYGIALILAAITIYPLLWVFCGAVNTQAQMGTISIIPTNVTFDRIWALFAQYNFGKFFVNSFAYAIAATAISLFFNSMAAYAFARLHFPGRDRIFALYLGTMMVPFSIIMMPLYLMIKDMGLNNSLWALILPGMSGAYGVFMLRQFYMGIPKELEEAARIDGLGYWGIYLNIILPLSKPIMLTQAVLGFSGCWNNYLWPTIVNSKEEVFLISQGLSIFASYNETDWNATLAGSAVSMVPIIILFIFFQKQLVDGVKLSGMKG